MRLEFESAVERNRDLFDGDPLGEAVRIELRDDLGENAPKELASFDRYRTGLEGLPCFAISSHLAFTALLRKHGIQLERFNRSCVTVWEHELIHLCDLDTLSEFSRQWDLAVKSGREADRLPIEEHPHREWEFLGAVAKLRSEGLATLYEWMCGSEEEPGDPREILRTFRSAFAALSSYLARGFDWQTTLTFDPDPYRRLHDAFRGLGYVAGPFMAFDAICAYLELTASPLRELTGPVLRALEAGRRVDIRRDVAIALIREGLALDPAAFVDMVGSPFVEHPWGPFFQMTEVAPLLHYAIAKKNDEAPLVDRVLRSLARNDVHAFIDAVADSIGVAMDADEIAEAWEHWRGVSERTDHTIGRELVARASLLIQIRERRPSDRIAKAIDLALTYLFDREDYLEDGVPYVGCLDDVCVLRVATAFAVGMT